MARIPWVGPWWQTRRGRWEFPALRATRALRMTSAPLALLCGLLVAFNLSDQPCTWALPSGVAPKAIEDHGLLSGQVDAGVLHLPAHAVYYATLY